MGIKINFQSLHNPKIPMSMSYDSQIVIFSHKRVSSGGKPFKAYAVTFVSANADDFAAAKAGENTLLSDNFESSVRPGEPYTRNLRTARKLAMAMDRKEGGTEYGIHEIHDFKSVVLADESSEKSHSVSTSIGLPPDRFDDEEEEAEPAPAPVLKPAKAQNKDFKQLEKVIRDLEAALSVARSQLDSISRKRPVHQRR